MLPGDLTYYTTKTDSGSKTRAATNPSTQTVTTSRVIRRAPSRTSSSTRSRPFQPRRTPGSARTGPCDLSATGPSRQRGSTRRGLTRRSRRAPPRASRRRSARPPARRCPSCRSAERRHGLLDPRSPRGPEQTQFDVLTIAFSEPEANEEHYARAVAHHYKDQVEYTVIEPPDEDLIVHADSYIHLMGEPFHSPNQFTNHRIWKTIADRGFRVNLYGAGGDEVLAGYAKQYYFPYLRERCATAGRTDSSRRSPASRSERPVLSESTSCCARR